MRESPVGLDHFLLSKTSSELLRIFRGVTQTERLSILERCYFAFRRLFIGWVVWLAVEMQFSRVSKLFFRKEPHGQAMY
jgi:hypothetical protein